MVDYAEDKRFEIPAAFTALNGAAQTFELEAGVSLEGEEGQRDLLRVLEVLRSNGAQPIITKVEGAKVTFTVEQTWVYGVRGNMQVSARKGGENEFASLEEGAKHDIEKIFGEIKAVDGKTKLFKDAKVVATMGALV